MGVKLSFFLMIYTIKYIIMSEQLNEEFTQLEHSDYAINELGIVKNLKTGNIIHPFLISGYPAVNIRVNGKKKVAYVHHLCALVFLNHIAKRGMITINHINGQKTCNRLDNLEIISHRRNSALTYISRNRELPTGVCKTPIGIRRYKSQINHRGINNYLGCYLTPQEASEVYQEAVDSILKTGELPERFIGRKKYDRYKKPE